MSLKVDIKISSAADYCSVKAMIYQSHVTETAHKRSLAAGVYHSVKAIIYQLLVHVTESAHKRYLVAGVYCSVNNISITSTCH